MTLIELIWTITPALILMLIAFPAEWFRKLFKRVKLSNFGKALKLLIPSHYRKIVSGWSNYSCKVKSQKMIEREMGNRETKSVGFMVFKSITVKEQRVYGSWYIVPLYLRCTLMGFERNYQVKILSNHVNKLRSYTSLTTLKPKIKPAIDPWFLTGFADGESCFSIGLYRNNKKKLGWAVQISFVLVLHTKDLSILYSIKSYLRVGNIYSRKSGTCVYLIQSIKDLAVIVNHFDKYSLITKKQADYLLFKMAVNLVNNKEHLTIEGLQKFVAIKASINRGLPLNIKTAFPDNIQIHRPNVSDYKIKDPNWLAGFVSAEGCFLVKIRSKPKMKIGYSVELAFVITQHSRDEQLMKSLIEYFGCGNIYKNPVTVDFKTTKFKDLTEKIIPFFEKYPIQGVKFLDYLDFVKVIKLIENKAHLTEKGLDQIRKIKASMNRGRK